MNGGSPGAPSRSGSPGARSSPCRPRATGMPASVVTSRTALTAPPALERPARARRRRPRAAPCRRGRRPPRRAPAARRRRPRGSCLPPRRGCRRPRRRSARRRSPASGRCAPDSTEIPITSTSSWIAAAGDLGDGSPQAEVDDLGPRIAERHRDHLDAAVVAVEPRLGEQDARMPHSSSPATITGRPSSSSVASRITQSRCATASTFPPYAIELPSAMCAVPLRGLRLHRHPAHAPRRVEGHRDLRQVASSDRRRSARASPGAGPPPLPRSQTSSPLGEPQHDRRRQRSLPHEQQIGVDDDGSLARRLDGGRARLDVGGRHVVAVLAREPVQHAPRPSLHRAAEVGAARRRQTEGSRLAPGRRRPARRRARIASKSTASGPSSRKVSRRTPGIARYRTPAASRGAAPCSSR